MADASQSPQGVPNACPYCGARSVVDLSHAEEDTPCPGCGRLLWFVRKPMDEVAVLIFLPGLASGSESLPVDEVISAAAGASRIAVDVSRLRVMTSMFLGMLVSLQRNVVAAQGTLRIFGVSSGHREVFRTTKLDTVFNIHGDEQSAWRLERETAATAPDHSLLPVSQKTPACLSRSSWPGETRYKEILVVAPGRRRPEDLGHGKQPREEQVLHVGRRGDVLGPQAALAAEHVPGLLGRHPPQRVEVIHASAAAGSRDAPAPSWPPAACN